MSESKARGNNPELWERLLADLDEKLQLGLLDRLRRVSAYHFESDTLFIEPASPDDAAYLSKGANLQHLALLAQDATHVEKVTICEQGKFPNSSRT